MVFSIVNNLLQLHTTQFREVEALENFKLFDFSIQSPDLRDVLPFASLSGFLGEIKGALKFPKITFEGQKKKKLFWKNPIITLIPHEISFMCCFEKLVELTNLHICADL